MKKAKEIMDTIRMQELGLTSSQEEIEKRIEERKKRAIEETLELAKIHKVESLKKYSMMDETMKKSTFENFKKTKENKSLYNLARAYTRRWQEMFEDNIGIMLYGVPGTGKTFAVACIANELIEQGVTVVMTSSISILELIKQTYTKYGDLAEGELFDKINAADLLIIDDLGAENPTSWSVDRMYKLIDSRYRSNKPMLITTNLEKDQLKNKLTGSDKVTRSYDRLVEMCQPMRVKGESVRVKEALRKKDKLGEMMKEVEGE